jgi:hypothetical protein
MPTIDKPFIDFSQYSTWQTCPWKWYERYVNKREPRPWGGQRDDAMCIGSLVHNGLEHWYRDKRPYIDDECIEEQTPTPETLALAKQLVADYVLQYPTEPWELVNVEEPLLRPILGGGMWLMAKVDAYFKVHEIMDLVATNEGHTITLTPGYWIQEYKTKSEGVSRANFMARWEVDRQASFQLLALEEKIGEPVQGVLINVIEKPKQYTPRRKCKGCGQMYELASFIPKGSEYACMVCGHMQKLKPYEPKVERTSDFFRIKVQRDSNTLERHLDEIVNVAQKMDNMRRTGIMELEQPTTLNCVDTRWGECAYFRNHTYNISTIDDPLMVEKNTTKYSGLVVL